MMFFDSHGVAHVTCAASESSAAAFGPSGVARRATAVDLDAEGISLRADETARAAAVRADRVVDVDGWPVLVPVACPVTRRPPPAVRAQAPEDGGGHEESQDREILRQFGVADRFPRPARDIACAEGNHALPLHRAMEGKCPKCGVDLHYGMVVDAPRGASYGWREGPPRPPRRYSPESQ